MKNEIISRPDLKTIYQAEMDKVYNIIITDGWLTSYLNSLSRSEFISFLQLQRLTKDTFCRNVKETDKTEYNKLYASIRGVAKKYISEKNLSISSDLIDSYAFNLVKQGLKYEFDLILSEQTEYSLFEAASEFANHVLKLQDLVNSIPNNCKTLLFLVDDPEFQSKFLDIEKSEINFKEFLAFLVSKQINLGIVASTASKFYEITSHIAELRELASMLKSNLAVDIKINNMSEILIGKAKLFEIINIFESTNSSKFNAFLKQGLFVLDINNISKSYATNLSNSLRSLVETVDNRRKVEPWFNVNHDVIRTVFLSAYYKLINSFNIDKLDVLNPRISEGFIQVVSKQINRKNHPKINFNMFMLKENFYLLYSSIQGIVSN